MFEAGFVVLTHLVTVKCKKDNWTDQISKQTCYGLTKLGHADMHTQTTSIAETMSELFDLR